MRNIIGWLQWFGYVIKDRWYRMLKGCLFKHNYETYPLDMNFGDSGKAAMIGMKCSRCGDWFNAIYGWQN
jgi:hypothetical protein